jgi:hypothetical protein
MLIFKKHRFIAGSVLSRIADLSLPAVMRSFDWVVLALPPPHLAREAWIHEPCDDVDPMTDYENDLTD